MYGDDVRPLSDPARQTSQNEKVARDSPMPHFHCESHEATVLAGASVAFPVNADETLVHASQQCSVSSITAQARGRMC